MYPTHHSRFSVLLCVMSFLILIGTSAEAQTHPAIILNAATLESIRDDVANPEDTRGEVRALAYRSIVNACEALLDLPHDSSTWVGQGFVTRALPTLALGHLLVDGDEDYIAYLVAHLAYLRANNYPRWGDPASPLGYADLLTGWAMAVDWCYADMDSQSRADNIGSVSDLVDLLPHEFWQEGKNDNNHVGVVFGARGLAALCLDGHLSGSAETERLAMLSEAADRVTDYLEASFQPETGSSGMGGGAGVEGGLYANYGLKSALPFALACADVVVEDTPVVDTARWFIYDRQPLLPFSCAPLNDCPPNLNMNHPNFRAWPWLLGVHSSQHRSAAAYYMKTLYPPSTWDVALGTSFTPGTGNGTSVPFSIYARQAGGGRYLQPSDLWS